MHVCKKVVALRETANGSCAAQHHGCGGGNGGWALAGHLQLCQVSPCSSSSRSSRGAAAARADRWPALAWAPRTGHAEVTPDFCQVGSSVGREEGQTSLPVVSLFPRLLSSWRGGGLQAQGYTRIGILHEIERCGVFVKRGVRVGCGGPGVRFLFLAEGLLLEGGVGTCRPAVAAARRGAPVRGGGGRRCFPAAVRYSHP